MLDLNRLSEALNPSKAPTPVGREHCNSKEIPIATSPLFRLPSELLKAIFASFTIQTLGCLGRVNIYFSVFAADADIWKPIAARLMPHALPKELKGHREAFKECVQAHLWELTREELFCLYTIERNIGFLSARGFPENFRMAYKMMQAGTPKAFKMEMKSNWTGSFTKHTDNALEFLKHCLEKDVVADMLIKTYLKWPLKAFKYSCSDLGETFSGEMTGLQVADTLRALLKKTEIKIQECSW